jgi:hypothetical protein
MLHAAIVAAVVNQPTNLMSPATDSPNYFMTVAAGDALDLKGPNMAAVLLKKGITD